MEPPFACPISQVKVLRVSGSDAADWLQGQLSCDLSTLPSNQTIRGCILTPTGQLIADSAVHYDGESFLLIADGPVRNGLHERLEQTIILEDVHLKDISDEFMGHVIGTYLHAIPNPRVHPSGCDYIGQPLPMNIPTLDENTWDAMRIEAGYPLAGIDYTEKTLAMEMGPHFVSTRISFSKGCYTGQEIVERIAARGHTNRTWVGLHLEHPHPIGEFAPGCTITTSAVSEKHGPIAAAFLRNDLLAQGEVRAATGNLAKIEPLPFSAV